MIKGVAGLNYTPHEGHLPLPQEQKLAPTPQVPPVWPVPPLPGGEEAHSPMLFSLEASQDHLALPNPGSNNNFTAVPQELARLETHPAAIYMPEEALTQIHTLVSSMEGIHLWLETPPPASGTAIALALEAHAPEEVPLPRAFPPAPCQNTQDTQGPQAEAMGKAGQPPLEIVPMLCPQSEAPCPVQSPLDESGTLMLTHSLLVV